MPKSGPHLFFHEYGRMDIYSEQKNSPNPAQKNWEQFSGARVGLYFPHVLRYTSVDDEYYCIYITELSEKKFHNSSSAQIGIG